MRTALTIALVLVSVSYGYVRGDAHSSGLDPCIASWTEYEGGKELTFCQLDERAAARENKKWEDGPETWDFPLPQVPPSNDEWTTPRKETRQ